jgi:hypothetical protein
VSTWRRWLEYAKARLDAAVRSGERDLDRREAQLESDLDAAPGLRSDAPTPTFEEAKARIEHRTGGTGDAPAESDDIAFDLAARERAAHERLTGIRESLGLDEADPPTKPR